MRAQSALKVFALKLGHFAPSQAAPRADEDEGFESFVDGVGALANFGDVEDYGLLLAGGAAGAADLCGVGREVPIGDGGRQHRVQQPVGVGAVGGLVDERGRMPGPYSLGGDVSERDLGQ